MLVTKDWFPYMRVGDKVYQTRSNKLSLKVCLGKPKALGLEYLINKEKEYGTKVLTVCGLVKENYTCEIMSDFWELYCHNLKKNEGLYNLGIDEATPTIITSIKMRIRRLFNLRNNYIVKDKEC